MDWDIRELQAEDIGPAFFNTLRNLSKSLDEDMGKARKLLEDIRKNPNHRIFAAIDDKGEVIGLTTLLVEQKFLKHFGRYGHLEDVVVRKEYERKGIGSALVKRATQAAKGMGCFRVVLGCSDEKIEFYERQGYRKDGNSMRIEFDDD